MQPVVIDFTALIRPQSLLGKIAGLRPVPFSTRFLTQATGVAAGWVGEGLPIPAAKGDFDATTSLAPTKVQSLSAHTRELARWSGPSIEMVLAQDASRAAALAADAAFIDLDNPGSAAKPASITRTATQIVSTGSAVTNIDADLRSALAVLNGSEIDLTFACWAMSPRTATYLATARGTGGSPAYPGMTAKGGLLMGLPAHTSPALLDSNSPGEANIALLAADQVQVADDGDVSVELSDQTSLQLVDNPSSSEAQVVSLWAHGLVGLKCTRSLNWRLRRTAAVAVITGVQF